MLDNYKILESMTGAERVKLVKTACRKLKKYDCNVIDVYINLFTHASTVTFEYENEVHQIRAICVRDSWDETKAEVPSIMIKEMQRRIMKEAVNKIPNIKS